MGGEGSMQAMNTILRNNRNMLRKKRMFDEKSTSKHSNIQLEFKNISDEELSSHKERIREKIKKEQAKFRLIFIIIAFVVLITFYFLFRNFSIDFDLFFRQI